MYNKFNQILLSTATFGNVYLMLFSFNTIMTLFNGVDILGINYILILHIESSTTQSFRVFLHLAYIYSFS